LIIWLPCGNIKSQQVLLSRAAGADLLEDSQ